MNEQLSCLHTAMCTHAYFVYTLQRNPIYVFPEKELRGLQISTFMCLWTIYIFPGSVLRISSLGRYVFGSEISYNKAPPACLG